MICSPACFLQTAAEKAERSALSGIVPADRLPEQQPQQSLAVERNQRIEVSLSYQRLGGAEQNEDAHHPSQNPQTSKTAVTSSSATRSSLKA